MKRHLSILIALALAAAGWRAFAQDTNGPEKLDFDSFKIIGQKNIFDPNRTGRRAARPAAPQRRVESVSLKGTIVSPQEEVAFFAGSGVPDKPMKVGDSVKELKITRITENGVRLTGPSNTFVLDFESRPSLRREEDGPWEVSVAQADAAPVAAAASSDDNASSGAPAAAAPASAGDSIAERLRKRRLEEK